MEDKTRVAVKNAPIVYVGQANVTTWPQQNNDCTADPRYAREIKAEQTQL